MFVGFYAMYGSCLLTVISGPADTVSVVFPCLGGPSPPPCVGSLEDDSHCLSFAQVSLQGQGSGDGVVPLLQEWVILLQCVEFLKCEMSKESLVTLCLCVSLDAA